MDSTKLRDFVLEEADKLKPIDVQQLTDVVIARLKTPADRTAALRICMQTFVHLSLNRCVLDGSTAAIAPVESSSEQTPGVSRRAAAATRWKLQLNRIVSPNRDGQPKHLRECTLVEVRLLEASHLTLAETHRQTAEQYGRLAAEMKRTGAATVADLPDAELRPILEAAA